MNKFNTLAIGLLLVSGSALADVEEVETFTFDLDSGGRFSLENVNGNIVLSSGRGRQVEVVATKHAKSEKGLERIEIRVDASDDRIRIETKYRERSRWMNWGNDGGSVDYKVVVPVDTNLDGVESVNGDVDIEGVAGNVDSSTVNGDLTIRGIMGDANLDSVNGDVEAYFDQLGGDQRVTVDTVNGSVSVYLPGDADVSVNAETLNGSMRAGDFDLTVHKGRFVGKDMEGQIGNGSARLRLDTVNGGVRVHRN